ncbi:kinase-like protein [Morchella conica CCBAS932]|uniref:Kinase-like protein n=1 Tax=Morchella conica CCBAS932 TaxID=1392247 RepID=A0A3N4KZM8_9PEZI|nr:kinase-like protein [Morchella conica CCBAS932]
MGISAFAPAFSFPGVVRDTRTGTPQNPAIDNAHGSEGQSQPIRQPMVRHVSTPSLQSPLRHHQRTASVGRPPIRETLNACLTYDDEEDGGQGARINQYTIKQEIGRGSFGAVHLVEDQTGKRYAMKEFSKSRLRKRSQSHILRRPHAAQRRGGLLSIPSHKQSASDIHNQEEAGNPLYLIREEIAILKKLDHENVAQLIEVLDDPEGDSLYIVLEMCEKGVIMKVGLDEVAEPYPQEKCRLWFRDMLLGIEYLHSQGIVHRDIKPDNLLLSKDDVLKIVDFGVSEMFEKKSPMMTAKSAGSPAFLPPELCYAGHGDISGTAADIWSMGVTLYCLLFGQLPFNHSGVIELYEAIKNEQVFIPENLDPTLANLLLRLLEKNPNQRITMSELREHPWVTRGGEDMLLSAEENTSNVISSPNEQEMASAITKSIRNVMAVVRAVKKLRRLTFRRSKGPLSSSSDNTHSISDPSNDKLPQRSRSLNTDNRKHLEQKLAVSGVSKAISMESVAKALPDKPRRLDSAIELEDTDMSEYLPEESKKRDDVDCVSVKSTDPIGSDMGGSLVKKNGEKAQAASPFNEPPLLLHIGTGSDYHMPEDTEFVSESPTLTNENVYEEAYRNDVARIHREQGQTANVYLTKLVE